MQNWGVPPKSPLPPRHGLQAAWVRTPDRDKSNEAPWPTMRAFLHHKLSPTPEDVDAMLADGAFVDDDGRAWTGDEPYRPHTFVWFHRTLREEPVVPGEIAVLHRDERIVVVDKPPFLSTIAPKPPVADETGIAESASRQVQGSRHPVAEALIRHFLTAAWFDTAYLRGYVACKSSGPMN